MTVRTKFGEGQVARFNSAAPNDPHNGVHVVVVAVNPLPLVMSGEHYRIYLPGADLESYASADELELREENN